MIDLVRLSVPFAANPLPVFEAFTYTLLEMELLGHLLQVPPSLCPDILPSHCLKEELLDVLIDLVADYLGALSLPLSVLSEVFQALEGGNDESLLPMCQSLDPQFHLSSCGFPVVSRHFSVFLPRLHAKQQQSEVVLRKCDSCWLLSMRSIVVIPMQYRFVPYPGAR